jgi:hypothetical protein
MEQTLDMMVLPSVSARHSCARVCVFVCVRNAVYFNLVLWKLMNQCSFCPYLWGPEAPRWASLIELCLGTLAKLALLSIGRDSLVR